MEQNLDICCTCSVTNRDAIGIPTKSMNFKASALAKKITGFSRLSIQVDTSCRRHDGRLRPDVRLQMNMLWELAIFIDPTNRFSFVALDDRIGSGLRGGDRERGGHAA